MRSSNTPRPDASGLSNPAEMRLAVTGLVRLLAAHGREIRRKDARACVMTWLGEGIAIPTDLEELERVMRQAPVPLNNRARHTAGGSL